jgi:hypothetical protein
LQGMTDKLFLWLCFITYYNTTQNVIFSAVLSPADTEPRLFVSLATLTGCWVKPVTSMVLEHYIGTCT